MLLEGKRLLITGVLTPQSIAFHVARVCQEEGAEVVLTSFGKAMGLTEKSARRLPQTAARCFGVPTRWRKLASFRHKSSSRSSSYNARRARQRA